MTDALARTPRTLGLRAAGGLAVAALVLGGAGGAALGALSTGADDGGTGPGGRPGQFQGQVPGGQQGQQGQPGLPPAGGLPPGTAPQQDVQPDAPSTSEGGTSTT